MSWAYPPYSYGGQQINGWYQEDSTSYNPYISWNQGPYPSEPNYPYTSWPTTDEPNHPYLQNCDEPFPIEASEDVYIPPYQAALNELLPQHAAIESNHLTLDKVLAQTTSSMAQDAKYLSTLFDETDKIIVKIPGLEAFSSQPKRRPGEWTAVENHLKL